MERGRQEDFDDDFEIPYEYYHNEHTQTGLYEETGVDQLAQKYNETAADDTETRLGLYQLALSTIKSEVADPDSEDYDQYDAAEALVRWGRSINDGQRLSSNIWSETVQYQLPSILGREPYDEIGKILFSQLKRGAEDIWWRRVIENTLRDNPESTLANLDQSVIEAVVAAYEKSGRIRRTATDKLQLSAAARKEGGLTADNIAHAKMAQTVISRMPEENQGIKAKYEYHRNHSKVNEIDLSGEGPNSRIVTLNELLIGNQSSDIDFAEKVIDTLHTLPEDQKPHVLVMSGLVQGAFKITEKKRRATLVGGLQEMDEQFAEAKKIIDQALELGIKVVYNMSNDDRRIADEATLEVVRQMREDSKGDGSSTITYWQADQLRADPRWMTHLNFQMDVVIPYSLRTGHAVKPGAEYYALFEAYHELSTGESNQWNDPFINWDSFIEREKLVLPGHESETDFVYTDDVNIITSTESGEKKTWSFRHNLNYSNEPMYGDPTKSAIDLHGQLAANGRPTPDALFTQHDLEAVGVDTGQGWVGSDPGFISSNNFLDTRASSTDAPGDQARRLTTTRRRLTSPGSVMHEFTDDGEHVVTFFNEALMAKASSLEEPIYIGFHSDWQHGSPTSRDEYQVAYQDMFMRRYASMGKAAILWTGDIRHGDIYPNFKYEGQSIGLTSMGSQKAYTRALVAAARQGVSAATLDNIIQEGFVPGNHEFRSGTEKVHGDPFTDDLVMLSDSIFKEKGLAPRAKLYGAAITPNGEYFTSWSGMTQFGEYGAFFQHYILERGAKGGAGSLPVYQALQHMKGVRELMAATDLIISGHWHHGQYGIFGDKAAFVVPSLAGISGFEWMRGYRAVVGGLVLRLGGGLPLQARFQSEKTLREHKITDGYFSDQNLYDQFGLKDDDGWDPVKHGINMPRRAPKSARQKRLREMRQDASEGADNLMIIRGRD